MQGFRLDHIGVAVKSLEQALPFWQSLMGLEVLKSEEVPTEKVKVAFLNTGECHLELLEPTSDESPIAKALEKRGPGIHHVCLKVQGLPELLEKLEAAGVQLIDKVPKPGANHKRIAFVHPKATGGILLELSEDMPETKS
ncbi:methylmalonyl-CoA epimerase [bacterium (Candidatus Blackallbacteria) CG17_big_fil_post_rev_8_21_14_2_50_48_46]|uniref:Methylmalonyl-CoA epimerase n=1 Tax=bacterium (Candidatus Blackallbacteria) CG17_big_fil_post_rev_8_21_14_2_50_48_46 TaxID=2014261 RepID=A0A2M7G9D7_9BACT|nr:MAG: methylmalonyl-CoA epimerase [bacterium (Candidatus Blackallbacteria) CG18_big_fil_WC_8_21_14_2_50_49_26]PIW18726.1 MAG: methylmalonyl-CoA epimerase [bacterium (Candidatus Blackallbacteria) CG17_big_fil_post_rev_8_21_14_2_50_48_46]PIW46602.1 MAG: methylmalonyl-CoA epimerase [bacterium (Candidatus Blackallbacteria) CG13_big_fil_rev_8_21_14_2_50_49_14]